MTTTPLSERPDFWQWILSEARKAHDRSSRNAPLSAVLERQFLDDVIVGDCCVSDNDDALLVHMHTVHGGVPAAARRLVWRWRHPS
jgi:hypothetical protein